MESYNCKLYEGWNNYFCEASTYLNFLQITKWIMFELISFLQGIQRFTLNDLDPIPKFID